MSWRERGSSERVRKSTLAPPGLVGPVTERTAWFRSVSLEILSRSDIPPVLYAVPFQRGLANLTTTCVGQMEPPPKVFVRVLTAEMLSRLLGVAARKSALGARLAE